MADTYGMLRGSELESLPEELLPIVARSLTTLEVARMKVNEVIFALSLLESCVMLSLDF